MPEAPEPKVEHGRQPVTQDVDPSHEAIARLYLDVTTKCDRDFPLKIKDGKPSHDNLMANLKCYTDAVTSDQFRQNIKDILDEQKLKK